MTTKQGHPAGKARRARLQGTWATLLVPLAVAAVLGLVLWGLLDTMFGQPIEESQQETSISTLGFTYYDASFKQQLVDCINSHQPELDVTTWKNAMDDKLTAIPVADCWWSAKQPAHPMTITTQMSLNRVSQLVAMCHSWPGPISAAVLVMLPNGEDAARKELAKARRALQTLHTRLEANYTCQLDLLMASERYEDQRTRKLYPVNVMRNYAKLQARTPMVGQFDADMLVSRTLHTYLQDVHRASVMANRLAAKAAIVLPAFITHGLKRVNLTARNIADRLAFKATSKAQLLPYFKHKILERFDPAGSGHRPTRTSDWFNVKDYYNVTYENRYEPWVIVDRKVAPFFDVRFRGYGQNKIIHLEHLNWTGFTFMVHPTAFLIHRFHEATGAKLQHAQDFINKDHKSAAFNRSIYGHPKMLGNLVRQRLRAGDYQPVTDPATDACSKQLPWWGDGKRLAAAR